MKYAIMFRSDRAPLEIELLVLPNATLI